MGGYNNTSMPTTTTCIVTICSIGIIANSLVVVVVRFRTHPKSLFMNLLLALAISEIVYLVTIIQFQRGIFGKSFLFTPLLYCRLNVFIEYVSGIASSWITVLISWERFIAVFFPFKVHIYCTKIRTYFFIIIIIVIASIVSLPFFYTCSVINVGGLPLCNFSSSNALADMIVLLIVTIVYSIAPFFIITILNILTMNKLRSHKTLCKRSCELKSSMVMKDASLVATLTAVCIVFAVTSFPASIVILYYCICCFLYGTTCSLQENDWLSTISFMLDDINHSVNFFLYCLTGSVFRTALYQLFKCRRRQDFSCYQHHSHAMVAISQNVV